MSAPRSMNALQVAERLIGLGLCPVALRSPSDPEEQKKPAAKRGKTPFQRGWQTAPVPQSADDLDLAPEHNVGIRTGATGAEFEVVAVDVDSEPSARWASAHLPPTPVKTYSGRAEAGWRGQHWFYKRPAGDAVGNRARISLPRRVCPHAHGHAVPPRRQAPGQVSDSGNYFGVCKLGDGWELVTDTTSER